eukprot:3711562-Pyramimonas_sp.AAC.1
MIYSIDHGLSSSTRHVISTNDANMQRLRDTVRRAVTSSTHYSVPIHTCYQTCLLYACRAAAGGRFHPLFRGPPALRLLHHARGSPRNDVWKTNVADM